MTIIVTDDTGFIGSNLPHQQNSYILRLKDEWSVIKLLADRFIIRGEPLCH